MAEHELRRHDAVVQQLLFAVDVAQDRVGESRALQDAGFDLRPIVGTNDERRNIEFPQPLEAGRLIVDIVGDAVLAHHARGRVDAVLVFFG